MLFNFLRGQGGERLERIEGQVESMIAHDRHEFDLAMAGLFGDRPPREVNDELRSSDRKVNEMERIIRRELMVHASVIGRIDTPVVLVYMSIVKDVERVGDYAKNLLDLALDGANFSTIENTDEWRRLTTDISQYITDCGNAFRDRNGQRCKDLLSRGDEYLSYFDKRVSRLVRGESQNDQPVPRALAHRYLKRVVAHLMNLLSAVVMPLDRLDYFDEDPEDRQSRE